MMRNFLLAATAAIGLTAGSAQAALILNFAQTSSNPTVTATDNGAATHITADAAVSIDQIYGGSPTSGFFNLNAFSAGPATTFGNFVIQHFGGTFCITSLDGCAGTNYLSGVF